MMKILDRINLEKSTYRKEKGTDPNVVFLTSEDEAELSRLTVPDITPEQRATIVTDGVRQAFNRLSNLRITWDAKEFSVIEERTHFDDRPGDVMESYEV